MAFLDISAVSKSFGSVSILRDVDLSIEQGEFVVFVGPSGCGKSTLLRMISGLEEISAGTISIEGEVMNEVEPADRGAAMVFQAGFRKVTLVPLDATYQASLAHADSAAFEALGTPAGHAASLFVEHRIAAYDAVQPLPGGGHAPIHDALAVASLIRPEVITTSFLHVDVETAGTLTVGRTVIDTQVRTEAFKRKAPNCHVAFGADRALFRSLLTEAFARTA